MVNGMQDLVGQLKEQAQNIEHMVDMAGPSLLTFPEKVDAARLIMVNSHFVQKVVPNKTELPKVFTNFENIVGEESSYNTKAEEDLEIIKIIHKFPELTDSLDIQTAAIFTYCKRTDTYDVIIRKDVENMTEKYGFQYDNSFINKYGEGDIIQKGETISRPTSFDMYDNYGFGRNVQAMYMSNDDTIEDAIKVSETLAKMLESTEVETVVVPINNNDILINLYGDPEQGIYKAFPNIGESTKNKILCCRRRLNKDQILFDLKQSNMSRRLNSDMKSYNDGIVSDIDIFCNVDIDEIPRTIFNKQLIDYIKMINHYHEEIRDFTRILLDSGSNCSQNIRSLNKRSDELTNPVYKVKDESNSEFGYIKMYFTIKRSMGLFRGQKVTGRYGNKGVCAKIVPDYMMPHLENGEVVHIVFNTLGVYNRLNIFQLFEQSINFVTSRLVEYFRNNKLTLAQKAKMLFRIMEIFNPTQKEEFYKLYKDMDKKGKEEYFDVIDKHGVQIHIQPFWHPVNLYEALQTIYKEFEFIKPYDVYFYEPMTKRWVKQMRKQVVGQLYIMKLKQSSKKQLSVCNYAPVGRTGVPEKTDQAKKHKTLVPHTPIKKGIQEAINTMISINPKTYAKQHMFYRSSPVGRRELGSVIIDNFGLGKPIEPELTDKITNRNVEVLQAYALIMGTELDDTRDELILPQLFDPSYDDKETKYIHKLDGDIYLASPQTVLKEYAKKRVIEKMENNEIGYIYIGQEGEYKDKLIDDLADIIESEILDSGLEYFKNRDELMD